MRTERIFVFIIIILTFNNSVISQVLCINCYRQNAPISSNITNLVLNGSFETSTCNQIGRFCPNSSSYNCDVIDWLCTGGGTFTYAHFVDNHFSTIAEGHYAVYFGNSYCKACSGVQNDTTCFIRSGCSISGIPPAYPENTILYGGTTGVSLSQNISGLTPGSIYVVEFWAGGEGNTNTFSQDGIFGFDIGFGNTFLSCPPTPYTAGTGKRYIIQFAAISSSHTLKFTNWGHTCSSCTELILDDVRLYPVSQLSSIIPACALEVKNADAEKGIRITQSENNHLIIQTDSDKRLRVIIYNLLAEKVLEREFTNAAELNLDLLQKGFYFCQIYNGVQPMSTEKIKVN